MHLAGVEDSIIDVYPNLIKVCVSKFARRTTLLNKVGPKPRATLYAPNTENGALAFANMLQKSVSKRHNYAMVKKKN